MDLVGVVEPALPLPFTTPGPLTVGRQSPKLPNPLPPPLPFLLGQHPTPCCLLLAWGQTHRAMGGINGRPLPQAALGPPGAGDGLASRKGGTDTEVNRPGC